MLSRLLCGIKRGDGAVVERSVDAPEGGKKRVERCAWVPNNDMR